MVGWGEGMKRTLCVALILILTLMCACTSKMVVMPGTGSDSEYAPENESERKGLIKYLADGTSKVTENRRKDAYRQMHEACGGKYIIAREQIMPEGIGLDGIGRRRFIKKINI